MRYRITGASRDTGSDLAVELDAADAGDAGRQAAEMNMLVAKIEPLSGLQPVEPFGAEQDSSDSDLARRLTAMRAGSAPDYLWLKLIGHAFNVFGFVSITLTLLVNLLLLLGVIGEGASQGNVVGFAAVGGVVAVFNIVLGVIGGAFMLGLGQALLAFRDIARNSWKLPQAVELLK